MKQSRVRRKRGVLLTNAGLRRLQAAILAWEARNNGRRLTLEELSTRIKISTKTLSRLWSLNATVDQRTLKLCFSAFALELQSEDYTIGGESDADETIESCSPTFNEKEIDPFSLITNSKAKEKYDNCECNWSYPDGPVPLNSPLYIERPPIEKIVYQEITQPGCAIRIHAPRQMGKSSLVLRVLAKAQQEGYYTVKLDCDQMDSFYLSDLNQFFRCFCWQVAKELGIEPNLDAHWDEEMGSKLSCSFYLKNYLLKQLKSPIVLALEQVDRFFEYPQLSSEFFSLLRSWCEEARRDTDWQKFRLVAVYSTEAYVSLDINRSPFNIGLPLRLNEFTRKQVEELGQRHKLDWSSGDEVTKLMSLVGGHPALIRIALYYLCCQGITLDELIEEALSNGGIYRYHLCRHWMSIQEQPSLVEAYTKVIMAQSISLDPVETYKLESLGLIRYEGDRIVPRCELYRAYFQKQISMIC
ncbi:AAA-like domain-containing protein [Scytonema sp. NUACC21]